MTPTSHPQNVSRLVTLDRCHGDAAPFIAIASSLVTASALLYELPIIYAIHIDNWFGPRWLGFRGKICGAAGVHSRSLKRSLVLPPFHPNRVMDATEHHLGDDDCFCAVAKLNRLHRHQQSVANLNNHIRQRTLHAWYSGNTLATSKGVVMVYFTTDAATKAWYAMFDGRADWRIEQQIGISKQEIAELIDAVNPQEATEPK